MLERLCFGELPAKPHTALRGPDGQVLGVLSFDLGGGTIDRLWLTTSAGKLAHWNR